MRRPAAFAPRCPFWGFVGALVLTTAACHPEFQLKKYSTNEMLYSASVRQFQHGKWDDAVLGFDKLTTTLAQRDTLLPLSYWYLGLAHDRQNDHLLAADAFNHIVTAFPSDSIAESAALEAARAYRKEWRRPALDPEYGQTAIQEYEQLLTFYPNSRLIPTAQAELLDLRNWFAIKDYDNAMYYMHLDIPYSEIIFLKDLLRDYPDVPKAKEAGLRLVDAYRAIKYNDDAEDVCGSLRTRYPTDADVKQKCPVSTAASKPPSIPPPGAPKPPPR